MTAKLNNDYVCVTVFAFLRDIDHIFPTLLFINPFPFSVLIRRHTLAPSWRRWTRTSRCLACTTGPPWSCTADTTWERSHRTSSPSPTSATAPCGRGCRTSVSSSGVWWFWCCLSTTRLFELNHGRPLPQTLWSLFNFPPFAAPPSVTTHTLCRLLSFLWHGLVLTDATARGAGGRFQLVLQFSHN